MSALADNIRYYRTVRGMTMVELGRRCGLSHSAISKFEAAQKMPTIKTLVRMARALDVAPASLIRGL